MSPIQTQTESGFPDNGAVKLETSSEPVVMSISEKLEPISPVTTIETENESKKKYEHLFALNEKVLSFHGPLLYDAKVLRRRTCQDPTKIWFKGEYYVHFLGWSERYDCWITEENLLKYNPQNIAIQNRIKINSDKIPAKGKKKNRKSAKNASKTSVGIAGNKGGAIETKVGSLNETAALQDLDTKDMRLLRSITRCVESVTIFQNTPHVEIPIPESLMKVLFDDWVLVVKKSQLLNLPLHESVDKILNDYFVSRGDITGSPEDMFTLEIDKMFKEEIQNLIYNPELIQFEFVRKCQEDVIDALPIGHEISEDVTSVYGLAHLLRMISKLGDIVAYSMFDVEHVERMMFHLGDFLKFLEENLDNYFNPKLYTLSPEDYMIVYKQIMDLEPDNDSSSSEKDNSISEKIPDVSIAEPIDISIVNDDSAVSEDLTVSVSSSEEYKLSNGLPALVPTENIKPPLSPKGDIKPSLFYYNDVNVKPALQYDDVKPALQYDDVKPALQSADVKPALQSADVKPALRSDDVKPALQSDVKPALQSDDVKPAFKSDDNEPYFMNKEDLFDFYV